MKVRALGLMSGGLDSMLAVRVLLDQGIEVRGITFQTPFFGPKGAQKAADQLGIVLQVVDIGEVHLQMLKKPQYGYGSQMNPCIDCHALMLNTAGRIMDEEGFDLLATGEVLGCSAQADMRHKVFRGRIIRPQKS